jgi:hypothetical protein
VEERVDAVKLHFAVAEVLAVIADAVPVAHHRPRLVAYLVTALARLHVQNLARRSSLEAGSTREKKGGFRRWQGPRAAPHELFMAPSSPL